LPLEFTNNLGWYAYSSPHIKYFHGRHAAYCALAILFELIVIGLSLLLLLEPVLSRKFNFVRIKPLLDQFQECYKDKYHCFAAYYLICRQVIFLIVYNAIKSYYNMLFYLQTTCVVMVLIHLWFQPYKKRLLNALDGLMLLLIVLIVNINAYPVWKDKEIDIVIVMIVILPLLLISSVAIKNLFQYCLQKYHYRQYGPIPQDEEHLRLVLFITHIYIVVISHFRNADELIEPHDHNYYQEPLFALNNDN